MTLQIPSRRSFLRVAGALGSAAVVSRYVSPEWLLAQASAADTMRTQMAATPIVVTKLTPSLTMLSGPGGNVAVMTGPTGKIVVDGFVKPVWPKLKAALDAIDGSAIKTMIDTHWHLDHADNNANFRAAGAGVIAHENTTKRLMQSHDLLGMHLDPVPSRELPTQTFPSGLTLNANGEQIALHHLPPAHTDSDIWVHFPKANVLHMGDLFFNGQFPFIDASTGGNIDGMIAAGQAALKMVNSLTKIIPGHGPLGDRAALQKAVEMMRTVRDRVEALKTSGKSLADVQAAKPTAEFDGEWAKGFTTPTAFVEIVYTTLK